MNSFNFFFTVDPVNLMQKNLPKVVRENLWIYDIDEDMLETVCKEIRSFYFNDKPIDHTMAREICNVSAAYQVPFPQGIEKYWIVYSYSYLWNTYIVALYRYVVL